MAEIDHGWRCPECGAEVFSGQPAQFAPMTCSFGHPPAEMEQVIVPDWPTSGPTYPD